MTLGATFDPDRVAHFEAAGWRACYDHRWPTVLWLMARLCREQFAIPFPVSWEAAYNVARAARAWAPMKHDVGQAESFLLRFYRLARRYSGLGFDPREAARLELSYYDVHRRLVGQADKTEFVDVMTALHSELFGLSPEAARPSAELRVAASNTVDRITSQLSTDIDADWETLEQKLRACYRSVSEASSGDRRGAV